MVQKEPTLPPLPPLHVDSYTSYQDAYYSSWLINKQKRYQYQAAIFSQFFPRRLGFTFFPRKPRFLQDPPLSPLAHVCTILYAPYSLKSLVPPSFSAHTRTVIRQPLEREEGMDEPSETTEAGRQDGSSFETGWLERCQGLEIPTPHNLIAFYYMYCMSM